MSHTIFFKLSEGQHIRKWLGNVGGDFFLVCLCVEISPLFDPSNSQNCTFCSKMWLDLLNGWSQRHACGEHYCRTLLGMSYRCTLIGIAPSSTPEMTFPITSGGPILVFLASFCYLSRSRKGFTATTMGHCFVTHSIASRQIGPWWSLNKFFPKKRFFNLYNPKSPFLSLPIAAHFLKMTWTGGNPWLKFPQDKPFGTFAAFLGSWGFWFKSIFT